MVVNALSVTVVQAFLQFLISIDRVLFVGCRLNASIARVVDLLLLPLFTKASSRLSTIRHRSGFEYLIRQASCILDTRASKIVSITNSRRNGEWVVTLGVGERKLKKNNLLGSPEMEPQGMGGDDQ